MPSLSNTFTSSAKLSTIALEFFSQGSSFLASQLAPPHMVDKQTHYIYSIDPQFEAGRNTDNKRAPGAIARTADFEFGATINYTAVDHALDHSIPIEVEATADAILQDQIQGTEFLVKKLLLEKEVAFVTLLASLTSASPSDKFNASLPTVGPLTYLRGIADTIRTSCGRIPNTLALDYQVFKAIVASTEFQDEAHDYKGLSRDDTSFSARARVLAELLDLAPGGKGVLVADGVKNTAAKGATASISTVWGENVFMGAVDAPSKYYGGTFLSPTWNVPRVNAQGGLDGGFRVREKYDDDKEARVIRVGWYYDQIIANTKSGYLLTNTLA